MEPYKLSMEDLKNKVHKLYRYVPWNKYTIDVITHRHLYLATASEMNDEWEFRISYVQNNNLVGSLKEMVANQEVELTVDDKSITEPFQNQNFILREADAQSINSDRKNIGIACFTDSNNNSMMWYHYADRYTGVCMEFMNIFGEDIDNIRGVFGAVSYGPYSRIDLIEQLRSNPLGFDPMYRFFYKSIEWQQESEYRYIIPVCQGARYFPFSDTTLSSIYCGFRMDEHDLRLLYDLSTRDNNGVRVYRSRLRENDFGLDFEEYVP